MNKIKILVTTLSLLLTAGNIYAADNGQQYSGLTGEALGRSAVPNPQSQGNISPAVNNLPQGRSIGANWQQGNQLIQANGLYQQNTNNALSGMPAWSQNSYYAGVNYYLQPFGAALFKGHFANTYSDNLNPGYVISPGDRIVIRIWGAKQYDDVLAVDQQGNIFIPEVGPVHVSGVSNSQLQSAVANKIGSVFTSNVEVYVNLQSSQPIGVFVTGFVVNPGQYAGGSYDSLLSFLDRAGGIDFGRGSFRNISVKRANKTIANYDLYNFLLNGERPALKLQDGDVVLVGQKKREISVRGLVKQEALYELRDGSKEALGQKLMQMAAPANKVSHVSISGIRNNVPVHYYLSLKDFEDFSLRDGDTVDFVADVKGQTIIAKVSGAITGASRFPISNETTLRRLLSYVEVERQLASVNNVYIKRRSVAEQQKATIEASLRRLEQSALTATSSSVDEAEIRVQEASLIQDFVKRASSIEPDGIVVVSRGNVISDIRLEDGDEVIIPQQSDVVLVSGEVMLPKAITFDKKMSLDDYLASAGGVTNRADDEHILVAKANGEVGLAENLGINPGDQVLVMPRFDSKNMQLAKDVMQIMYQLAVATKVVVDL